MLLCSTAGIVADDDFPGLQMRDLGAHRLKGLVWPEQVFQLVIDGLASEFPSLATPEGAGPATETVTVFFTDLEGMTKLQRRFRRTSFAHSSPSTTSWPRPCSWSSRD